MSEVVFLEGKKISCIINPASANRKWKKRKKLRRYLKENLPAQIIDSYGDKAHTIKKTRELCLTQEIIVAAGGDGTVADVIQGIVEAKRNKDILFGIIPLGSGNAFRKSLHIPKNTRKAVTILNKGEIKEIDMIKINGKVASFASIGATAKATQMKLLNRVPGLFGHIWAAKIFFTLPKKEQEIELYDGTDDRGKRFDKKNIKLNVFDCVIGNTKHFGYSWRMAPKAQEDDGYLDITLFEINGIQYLFLFPFIYLGLLQRTQKHFKAKHMIVRGNELPVQYNGEFLGIKDEIELKILPRALKIIIPEKQKRMRNLEKT